ncbi:MAG TPA: TolC family protein [Terriglobia bacterium]|nr:TolC family protein [Terriglobia bacterium]
MIRRCGLLVVFIFFAIAVRAQAPQKLTLAEAQQIAARNHPQLGAARFAAQAASQVVTETQSAYYPFAYGSLTGAGALPNSRIAAGALNNPIIYNRYSDGVAVNQLITDFGRTQNLVQSSRLRSQAVQESVQATREDVLFAVTRAYFGALRAKALLKVAQETVDERQLVVDQVTELAQSKLRSGLDVSFAGVNLAEAKLLLVQAEDDVQGSFATLSEALGDRDQLAFELSEVPLPGPPPPDLPLLIGQALRERPELVRQRFNQQATQKFARAERDLWFPTVSSVGAAGLTPYHQKSLTDRYAAAGVNINIPIFNGRLFSARRAEADFRAQAEDENLRTLEDQVARDVRIAWLNSRTQFERLDLTDQLLKQARLAVELAQSRYKLGLGSIVELSQAQLNQTQAQIEQAAARYDYQISSAALQYQLGALR